jgi:hypothetical protein
LLQINVEWANRVQTELAGKLNAERIKLTDDHASTAALCDKPNE